jgi:hypothetical protein
MKRAVTFVISVVLGGCALSHEQRGDAGRVDAAGIDAAASPDAGSVTSSDGGAHAGPDGALCGPNRCRTDEVCCDDRCGICAYEGECPSFECPEPADP